MPRIPRKVVPPAFVAIDPGDKYVGWTEWVDTKCVRATELTPWETLERLEIRSGWPYSGQRQIDTVVCERWVLYPWNEESFAFNEFLTSQLIGQIKYVCRRAGVEFVGQTAQEGKAIYDTEPFKQWTTKDWQAALNGPIGKGHTKDSYVHGIKFMRSRGWTG